jgi:hypothetical protein
MQDPDGSGASAREADAVRRGDRAVRHATTTAVVVVAAIAGIVSYRHMHAVALRYGEDQINATIVPLSVDGLIVAASMTLLAESRAHHDRSWLAYILLCLGSLASLAANVLHAEPDVVARIIAAWPVLALVGSYELLMRQIRAEGATGVDGTARPDGEGPDRGPRDEIDQLEEQFRSSTPIADSAPATTGPASTPIPAMGRPDLEPVYTERGAKPVATTGSPPPASALPRQVRRRSERITLATRAYELLDRWTADGDPVDGPRLKAELDVSDGYARKLIRRWRADQAPGRLSLVPRR